VIAKWALLIPDSGSEISIFGLTQFFHTVIFGKKITVRECLKFEGLKEPEYGRGE